MLNASLFRYSKYERIHRLVDQALLNAEGLPVRCVLRPPHCLRGEDGFIKVDDPVVLALQFSE